MDGDDFDDSMNDALASINIPTPPKIPKVLTAVASCSNCTPSCSRPSTSKDVTEKYKFVAPTNSYYIQVNPKQRGNPVLKGILNCPYEFKDIVPDYVVGRTSCVMYLSLKYHNLNPEYICQRLKELGKQYALRVLLVQVDTVDPHNALKSLTRISLLADLTLMLAWSPDEAGRIIENYKMFENKGPDLIMERVDTIPHQKLITALTSIKPVNKTDAMSLLQSFGNLCSIASANEGKLSMVTGLGPQKIKKLHKTLNEPFLK